MVSNDEGKNSTPASASNKDSVVIPKEIVGEDSGSEGLDANEESPSMRRRRISSSHFDLDSHDGDNGINKDKTDSTVKKPSTGGSRTGSSNPRLQRKRAREKLRRKSIRESYDRLIAILLRIDPAFRSKLEDRRRQKYFARTGEDNPPPKEIQLAADSENGNTALSDEDWGVVFSRQELIDQASLVLEGIFEETKDGTTEVDRSPHETTKVLEIQMAQPPRVAETSADVPNLEVMTSMGEISGVRLPNNNLNLLSLNDTLRNTKIQLMSSSSIGGIAQQPMIEPGLWTLLRQRRESAPQAIQELASSVDNLNTKKNVMLMMRGLVRNRSSSSGPPFGSTGLNPVGSLGSVSEGGPLIIPKSSTRPTEQSQPRELVMNSHLAADRALVHSLAWPGTIRPQTTLSLGDSTKAEYNAFLAERLLKRQRTCGNGGM